MTHVLPSLEVEVDRQIGGVLSAIESWNLSRRWFANGVVMCFQHMEGEMFVADDICRHNISVTITRIAYVLLR